MVGIVPQQIIFQGSLLNDQSLTLKTIMGFPSEQTRDHTGRNYVENRAVLNRTLTKSNPTKTHMHTNKKKLYILSNWWQRGLKQLLTSSTPQAVPCFHKEIILLIAM